MLRVSTNEYQKRLESLQGNLTAAPPETNYKGLICGFLSGNPVRTI